MPTVYSNYPVHRQKVETPPEKIKSYNKHEKLVLPKSLDLRSKMPAIFDQGELGSCTANAGIAFFMVWLAWKLGIDISKVPTLSRLFEYFNERLDDGTVDTDAGAEMVDIVKVLQECGACLESLDPYDIAMFKNKPSAAAYSDALTRKLPAYSSVTTVDDIKTYMAVHQLPVLMGMDVFSSFESDTVAATGKVPMPTKKMSSLGGHAVLIVGYMTIGRTKYFIVRNSWGDQWGDKGYFYLPEAYITAGHAYDFYVAA